MQIVDHVFILLLFVVQPVNGVIELRRYLRQIEAGEAPDRAKFYLQTVIIEWLAFAGLAAIWFYYDRSLTSLGFTQPGGTGFWIGAALLLLGIGFLVRTLRSVKSITDEERLEHRESFGHLVHFLPHTRRDLRTFYGVSLTAGIVEETIYRGFVLWYLTQLMPIWAAVVVSAIFFGLAHGYQGANGVVRVGLVGLAFGAFFVLTGSIWLPIIGHVLLDALQGATTFEILRDHKSHSGNPSLSSGSTIDAPSDGPGGSGSASRESV